MSVLGKIAVSVALGVTITGALALGLIASDRPVPDLHAETGGLDFSVLQQAALPDLRQYVARDGASLGFRRWDAGQEGAPLIVAVHGSGWHGAQFAGLGAALSAQGFDVIAPDLRGHGPAPQRRGDIDYIGQFEDDLADLIAREAASGQEVVLLGHSSGGGLVIRFAGGGHRALIDRAVLLAPFVQYDAPTARPESGGWARVMTRRIIGLTMLNAVRIRALNALPVIQFRFPSSVLDGPQGQTATRAYSYRLNASFAPRRNWQADVAALPPFLLIAGAQDEAFRAEAYEPTFRAITERGRYTLTGASHLSVVDDPETAQRIVDFLRGS
ncbi:alpha/beta hydrolase [Pararhodobacter zhoushanensis]|uniref:Lysophospholipase n=1 Tax=Pararhodobacter zhoushanensis TaxID=2479545 RepID=A0ABT3GZ06_9RHOB|nr:lysophospholipase [Pararhodobacter zhoushanensis]MCW1932725.1 lysophospholipase [Pararhodobacter zhoushanensis]